METLIQITTGGQGSPVVSARELYAFLEVKTKFADWIKARIIKYGFQEGGDYVEIEGGFSENSEKPQSGQNRGGRIAADYALTLDMAKELSMVERNDKGKQARQYFISCEQNLRQLVTATPTALSTEQVLIQLVSQQQNMMVAQNELLSTLRADVDTIMHGQRPAKKARALQPPHVKRQTETAGGSLRQAITRKVNDYCGIHGVEQSETYNYLYKRMYDVYGVSVHRFARKPGEYLIDALERYGHLDRLYSLIMAELTYIED